MRFAEYLDRFERTLKLDVIALCCSCGIIEEEKTSRHQEAVVEAEDNRERGRTIYVDHRQAAPRHRHPA